MTIVPLSQSLVRAIGSSQVLFDSASLVKELIDNALDAKALSIFIEISANTLDLIQVKDDGHGIHPSDRGLLGRRHFTSKIRDLHDLHGIAGNPLGFRGVALASVIEMSGAFSISTKYKSDPVAELLRFGRKGRGRRVMV